jgi:hypothetical protein
MRASRSPCSRVKVISFSARTTVAWPEPAVIWPPVLAVTMRFFSDRLTPS